MDDDRSQSRHTQRDREVLMALGVFLIVLSVPVLIGILYEEGLVPSIVNAVAGLLIGGIGAGMFAWGRRPVSKE